MGAQHDMIAANAAETAAVQLATAYANYLGRVHVRGGSGRQRPGRRAGLQDVADLEGAVGPGRFAQGLHGRLLALGAGTVLSPPGSGPVGPEWTTWITGQIEAHVPAVAGASARDLAHRG
jgi:hypothetical protein